MNVYDFDGTIYDGDSSIDLFIFAVSKYKRLLVLIPKIVIIEFLFLIHIINKRKAKETLLSFLKKIDNNEKKELVHDFWLKNDKKIRSWYIKQKKNTDVIISASPNFLLQPLCDRLNVSLISTKIDVKTGRIIGENCYGKEKLIQFNKEFKNLNIDNLYTDSFSDKPLMKVARKVYIVKKGKPFYLTQHFDINSRSNQ